MLPVATPGDTTAAVTDGDDQAKMPRAENRLLLGVPDVNEVVAGGAVTGFPRTGCCRLRPDGGGMA
jgi:hypothetical protein